MQKKFRKNYTLLALCLNLSFALSSVANAHNSNSECAELLRGKNKPLTSLFNKIPVEQQNKEFERIFEKKDSKEIEDTVVQIFQGFIKNLSDPKSYPLMEQANREGLWYEYLEKFVLKTKFSMARVLERLSTDPLENLIGTRHNVAFHYLNPIRNLDQRDSFADWLIHSKEIQENPEREALYHVFLIKMNTAIDYKNILKDQGKTEIVNWPEPVTQYLRAHSILKGFEFNKIDEALKNKTTRLQLGQEILENFSANALCGTRWLTFIGSSWAKQWARQSKLSGPKWETPRKRLADLAKAIVEAIKMHRKYKAKYSEIGNLSFFDSTSGFIAINDDLVIFRGKATNNKSYRIETLAPELERVNTKNPFELQRILPELFIINELQLEQVFGYDDKTTQGQRFYHRLRSVVDIPYINMVSKFNY